MTCMCDLVISQPRSSAVFHNKLFAFTQPSSYTRSVSLVGEPLVPQAVGSSSNSHSHAYMYVTEHHWEHHCKITHIKSVRIDGVTLLLPQLPALAVQQFALLLITFYVTLIPKVCITLRLVSLSALSLS